MNVGSLFSGAGGFDLGFERAGHRIAWQAEIEPHACAVLREHWPDVPNLGDVSDVNGGLIEPVDAIIGGFPCQDVSVAGARAGMQEGARSSLFFQFMRIVREMRHATNGRAPAFVVIENVPGLRSSKRGHGDKEDFAVLLDTLAQLGALDITWRSLDGRYLDVPQRRERVFFVVDFGGHRAGEILLESEGVRGDSAARGTAGKDVAGTLGGGAGSRSWAADTDRMTFVTAPTLLGRSGKSVNGHWSGRPSDDLLIVPTLDAQGPSTGQYLGAGGEIAHTLRASGFDASEDGTGRGTPIVAATLRGGSTGGARHRDTLHCAKGQSEQQIVAFDTTQITHPENRCQPKAGDPCHPLAAGAHPPAVVLGFNARQDPDSWPGATGPLNTDGSTQAVAFTVSAQSNGFSWESPVAPTLQGHPQSDTSDRQSAIRLGSLVRRLTPRECERLMSWGDDFTRYGVKPDGTRYELADGPRYRLCGNGVVANVAFWIARRLP